MGASGKKAHFISAKHGSHDVDIATLDDDCAIAIGTTKVTKPELANVFYMPYVNGDILTKGNDIYQPWTHTDKTIDTTWTEDDIRSDILLMHPVITGPMSFHVKANIHCAQRRLYKGGSWSWVRAQIRWKPQSTPDLDAGRARNYDRVLAKNWNVVYDKQYNNNTDGELMPMEATFTLQAGKYDILACVFVHTSNGDGSRTLYDWYETGCFPNGFSGEDSGGRILKGDTTSVIPC